MFTSSALVILSYEICSTSQKVSFTFLNLISSNGRFDCSTAMEIWSLNHILFWWSFRITFPLFISQLYCRSSVKFESKIEINEILQDNLTKEIRQTSCHQVPGHCTPTNSEAGFNTICDNWCPEGTLENSPRISDRAIFKYPSGMRLTAWKTFFTYENPNI